jgi:hypothetical protein
MDDALEEGAGGENDRLGAVFIASGIADAEVGRPAAATRTPPFDEVEGGQGGSGFTSFALNCFT